MRMRSETFAWAISWAIVRCLGVSTWQDDLLSMELQCKMSIFAYIISHTESRRVTIYTLASEPSKFETFIKALTRARVRGWLYSGVPFIILSSSRPQFYNVLKVVYSSSKTVTSQQCIFTSDPKAKKMIKKQFKFTNRYTCINTEQTRWSTPNNKKIVDQNHSNW